MAHKNLVVTLLCQDKPGIVQQIADVIVQVEGNWLESRMSQLAGKFAGILKVSIDEDNIDQLTEKLGQLSTSGIKVLVEPAQMEYTGVRGRTLGFELIGADRIDIVSEISHAFSEKGISIDDLETRCSSMPWSGEPLFEANGILIAPQNINKDELMDRLYGIEDKLGIDITISEQL